MSQSSHTSHTNEVRSVGKDHIMKKIRVVSRT